MQAGTIVDPDHFPVELVRGQLQAMLHAGYELSSMRSLDLPPEVFQKRPLPHSTRMSLALAGRAMSHCKFLLEDESYGFSSKDRLAPGHTKLLWLSSLHGSNLGEVLSNQYALASQLGSNYGFTTHHRDGVSQWGFCRSSCDSDIPADLLQRNDLGHLYWWYRVACWFIGEIFPLETVSVMGEDHDTKSIAEQLFGCPVQYEQPRFAINFSDSYLNLPVVRGPKDVEVLRNDIGQACLDVQITSSRTTTELVSSILETDISLLMEHIADRVHCSRHTLIRRLHSEGTSFQKLKDGLRMTKAEQLLRDDSKSIESISASLGFANPPAFTRAFRGWFNLAPSQFRQNIQPSS